MSSHLFAYGILMFPELVRAVTGREVEMLAATLHDHARRGLPHPGGEVFAAITPSPGKSVPGRLLRDVTTAEIALFDRVEELETGYYVRREVVVQAGGRTCRAWAYLVGPALRGTLAGDWDPAAFDERSVRRYIAEELPRLGIGVDAR